MNREKPKDGDTKWIMGRLYRWSADKEMWVDTRNITDIPQPKVTRTINGKRSQAFLKEMLAALDSLPEKRLIAEALEDSNGGVCAIGTVGKARNVAMSIIDPEDYDRIAGAFNVAPTLVRELEWQNDEAGPDLETPEQRFERIRAWVVKKIKE